MASFEKSQNGTWSVRFRAVEDGMTKNKRLSGFRTKKDAEKAFADYVHDFRKFPQYASVARFEDMYYEWLEHQKPRVKTSTFYSFESRYNAVIKKDFANKQLNEITPLFLKNWQSKLIERGYSQSYCKKLQSLVEAVFKYAVHYYDYPNNPFDKIEAIRLPDRPAKKEKTVWDKQQFSQFIENVNDEPYRAFFIFLYYTGCRKAEALALTWDDIDFDNATVTINKTYTRKIKGVPYKIENTPKTASSIRTIKLPSVVINALKSPYFDVKEAFVFGGKKPLPENTLRQRLERYLDKATAKCPTLSRLTFHEFRHSHASLLISNGISIVTVSKRLGHANINETLKTYSHLMNNDEDKAIAFLDEQK